MVSRNLPNSIPPIGIDIGNSKCVLAISRGGIVDALANEFSSRETPNLVHFATNHRLFGDMGAGYSTSIPSSTISQIKRLVGLPADSNRTDGELRRLPYETSIDADGFVSIKVPYLGNDQTFTSVEMLTMLLAHLRKSAEKNLRSAVSDCVIGVPSYFTEKQKEAYTIAALAAKWNPLELLHDGTAAAMDYGTNRKHATDTIVVAFVDIGHCDSQITVARFLGQEVSVISEACDAKLGGRDFDEVLFDHFAQVFEKQNGIDVCSDGKAKAKLRVACEKTKKVLNVNKEAHTTVDSLMGGVDFDGGVITREHFDQMSSHLLRRIQELFREALKKANVSLEGGVHYVELVGSGSRIPAISKALTDMMGLKMSRTLNGSECIANGCALRCEELLNQTYKDNDHETEKARRRDTIATSNNKLIATGNLSEARVKEQKLEEQDRDIEFAKEGRNDLEAYIYKSRNKVERITNESERDSLSAKLAQMEEWLCKEGDEKSKSVFETKIQELKLVFSPEKTQIQANAEVQDDVMVQPVPERSLTSAGAEVSPEDRGPRSLDQPSSRKRKSEIEAKSSGKSSLLLPGEAKPKGSSSRMVAAIKKFLKNAREKLRSACLSGKAHVKSPRGKKRRNSNSTGAS